MEFPVYEIMQYGGKVALTKKAIVDRHNQIAGYDLVDVFDTEQEAQDAMRRLQQSPRSGDISADGRDLAKWLRSGE